MSQLIHLRQRIRAVHTIKKITSAMRLISRSFHTRMYRNMKYIHEYTHALSDIFYILNVHKKNTLDIPLLQKKEGLSLKKLYLLVGSQKGLCGNYNTTITHWIDKNRSLLLQPHVDIFVLSKKIEDHLKKVGIPSHYSFSEIKISTIDAITQKCIDAITNNQKHYTEVFIVANQPKTFFSHEYKVIQLIPFEKPDKIKNIKIINDYSWSHSPEIIFETLIKLHLKNTIYATLFISLSGEQSARFVAMDNANRNAQNFLDTMNLQFNKIRQAKITKELSELAGAFESQLMI